MVVMIDDCMQKVAFARYPAFGGSRSESFCRRRTREAYFRTTGDRSQESGLGTRDSGDHLGGLRQQD